MAGFDPDAYLREKSTSGFDPDAYLAQKVPRLAPGAGPSAMDALGRGAAQGVTAGFGDEATAAAAPFLDDVFALLPDSAIGTQYRPKPMAHTAEAYRERRDYERAKNQAAEKAHGRSYLAGQLAGGLASTPLVGGGLGGAVGYGAASGLGGSDADITKGEVGRAAVDTAVGGTVGALAHGLTAALGGVGKAATGKVQQIEAGMAENAARKAAAETATARSAAGRSSQEVVRAIEKIEEFKSAAPDIYKQLIDNGTLKELQREYVEKAAGELPAKLAGREAAGQALAEAAQGEGSRAAAGFEQATSPGAAVGPLGRALKRYALRAGTGAVLGGGVGALSGHGGEGAAIGAAGLNLALAPTLLKHANSPAMRRLLLKAAAGSLGGLEQAGAGAIPAMESQAVEAGIPDLAMARAQALIAALRQKQDPPQLAQGGVE